MEIAHREALERFARQHHVRYEVERETAVEGGHGGVVGYDVHLLASEEGAPLEAPGCPRCLELLAGLRSFAEELVASAGAAGWTEIVPEPAVLHASDSARTDEVTLTVRVQRDPAQRGAGDAADDPRLKEIRDRLEALGAPRG